MKENNKALPKTLEKTFEEIRAQVNLLHARWKIYRQLYGTSEERVDLLNESAPVFFRLIQDILWDEIQLSISKLSDPAQTRNRKRKSLSLTLICQIVKELGEEKLYSNLCKSLSRFGKKCEAFRVHRNKRIAHFDFDTFINEKSKPLPRVSRAMIEDALKELRFFMNLVDGFYKDTEMGYEYVLMTGDGEALITFLAQGLRYEELLRAGKIDIMDFQKSKYFKV